ncbi:MAG: hypothetical protein Tsb0020_28130 [Haliangiales bacterium]
MTVSQFQHTYPLETCMFSAHQLHGEEALRIAVQTATGHLAERGLSLQSLLSEHQIALVVTNAVVTWVEGFDFLTDTTMVVDNEMRLRHDGKLLKLCTWISAAGQRRVSVDFAVRPIRLSGGASLDATPSAFKGELRENFSDQEIDRTLRARALQRIYSQWRAEAEVLGQISASITIRRSDCEFADQWRFIRLPALVSDARERLGFANGGALAYGLSRPVKTLRCEWWRPMYLGDAGRVDLEVLQHAGEVHFIYQVTATDDGGGRERQCAIAVESYGPAKLS